MLPAKFKVLKDLKLSENCMIRYSALLENRIVEV